jgi:DtxR family Mn-dependent transcriptional regulator
MTTERISQQGDPTHTSESEEMYLITVARAAEDGRTGPLPVAMLAAHLEVSVASANEMVRKLAGRDLLNYEPYHGVELTAAGNLVADRVLRIRRLWATFLAEHLGFGPSDADDQACQLEHVTTEAAADRLAGFLGDPEAGPLGRPIPRGSTPTTRPSSIRLADLGVGDDAEVVSVASAERAREFLANEGVVPGARLSVAGVGDSGLLIDLEGGPVHLNQELADAIEVRRH